MKTLMEWCREQPIFPSDSFFVLKETSAYLDAMSRPRPAYVGCISCDATGKTRGAICPRCDGVGFHAFVHAPSWEEQARAWRDIAECHLGAIQTLQSEIAAAQRELKRPVEITEAMIARALLAFSWYAPGKPLFTQNERMRSALQAALNHGDA